MDTVEAARAWIQSSLLGRDAGLSTSRFESRVILCQIRLRGSFLASLINRAEESASYSAPEGRFRYQELIRQVARVTGGEKAWWFYVTDPDNALSVLEWVRECHYDCALDASLSHFETNPAAEGGVCRLGLLGSSGRWLLFHECEPDELFTLSFHGPGDLCADLHRTLKCTGEGPSPRRG